MQTVVRRPPIPKVTKPLSTTKEEFEAFKKAIKFPSWEMSPTSWSSVKIDYNNFKAADPVAKLLLKVLQLPSPEM
ncbi:MAG: hypothetical protein N3G80_02125 [Candidatus Micrarchaeota archaeon]|nr:hypothetical protein [Candidatus Micrarchaeota archaeon]